jgi:DNA ligase-1
MRYLELSELYGELEKTPAKLEKTRLIAELLKKTPSKLLPDVVLLLIGRVFPAWTEKETGVAGQTMVKAIARASGRQEKEVQAKFKATGDLGLVAEEYIGKKKQATLARKDLTVEFVFESIQRIAEQAGKGSQDRKLNVVASILAHANGKEAKYIVRTVLEVLRVGVAEGIVRDSIAKAFDLTPKTVEGAWFLRPNYGEIAKIAKEEGESGLKAVKMDIGTPVVVLLAEKAPDLEAALKAFEHPSMEFKYDGMRTQIHKKGDRIWLYTRRLENITHAFPDLVKLAKAHIKSDNCIIEGETLALDPKTGRPMPFQMLSTRIKRKHDIDKAAKDLPVQINLFDVLYLDGKSYFDSTLREREQALKGVVSAAPGKFQLAERLVTKDLKEADEFYKRSLASGQEGLMVKNLEATYHPGRRVAGGWLKVKPIMETLDLAIIGAVWGTGKRAGFLGSFILGVRDTTTGKFLECGMLGTGIKEKKTKPEDVTLEELTNMMKPLIESEKGQSVKIKPSVLVEVAYEEIQKSPTYSSGWALRFPRFVRLRPEKGIRNADNLERIKALYNMQKGKG